MEFDPMFIWGLISVPLFLLCKSFVEIKEENNDKNNTTLNTNHNYGDKQKFVEKYANVKLERKINEYVNNRENHNEIYEYLESFKEKNPEWCFRNEIPAFERKETDWGEIRTCKIPNMKSLDWYNVGKKRFDLSEYDYMATQMVTNSLGVWTGRQAEILFDADVSPNRLEDPFPSYYQFHFIDKSDLGKHNIKDNPYL